MIVHKAGLHLGLEIVNEQVLEKVLDYALPLVFSSLPAISFQENSFTKTEESNLQRSAVNNNDSMERRSECSSYLNFAHGIP